MKKSRQKQIALLFLRVRYKNGNYPKEEFIQNIAQATSSTLTRTSHFFDSFLKNGNMSATEQRDFALKMVKAIFKTGDVRFPDSVIVDISNETGVSPDELTSFFMSV